MSDDRGTATVEAALAICALLAFLALCAGGLAAVIAQLRCTDAAREAARLVARGDSALAESAVAAIAPADAHLTVRLEGDTAWTEVTATEAGLTLRARAYAVLEPTPEEPREPSVPTPRTERSGTPN
ncbi:Flp pilus assembly protein TadG [Saccharothrix coeruleofusca]|uniref:TadE family type IV pilus minor pilin n=1 Tax=Saccharothrix coeruleofusca TaxID=33919 RepID=UPI0027DAC324|nr:TadE family type IV pilus minor pilin [Saccharothrix coeruleofusca]MBP2340333.1 Flp pilus assembly protein TadG [Saccharothrix coeruleofusca]